MKPDELKAWLESRFDRVESRFDGVEKVQVRQEAVLEEHIRRTVALEKNMEPIRTHVAIVGAAAKIILALAAVAGAIAGVMRAIQ